MARAGTVVDERETGCFDAHWSTWLAGLTLTHEEDGTTTLRGVVSDQAQLHGLLGRIRDLGVALISVIPLGPGSTDPIHPSSTDPIHPSTTEPTQE